MPYLPLILIFWFLLGQAMADTNVTAEDNEIIWPSSSPTWSSTATVCSSQGQAHFAFQRNMSMSYEFTGTAIYVRILRSDVTGIYAVSVDGSKPALTDGFHTSPICDVQFGQTGLSFSSHTVTVALIARSSQVQNDTSTIYLELDAFIYTTPDNLSSSSVSPTSTTTSQPSTSSKASLKPPVIAGIAVAIAVFLVAIAAIVFILLRKCNGGSSMTPRLTVLDRDVVFPGHIPQSPPIPDSHHTHQTSSPSDMPSMHLAEQTYSDHASSSSPSPWHTSASIVIRNREDAPPEYHAPRVETKEILQTN